MTLDEIMAYLAPRTIEEGDCLLWTRSTGADGTPMASFGGSGFPVRRWIWMQLHPDSPIGTRRAVAKCGNLRCVIPHHVVARSPSEFTQGHVDRGAYNRAAIRAAITAARRLRSDLTIERVREMRAKRSGGALVRELATEYGVSESAVSAICTQRAWKDHANPFAGLMR